MRGTATERHWIDWAIHFLPEAGAWLIKRFTQGATVDMRDVVCVTPGRRAGRILLAQLARACTEAGLDLVPPRTITPGTLAETLLETDGAIATRQECLLAWMIALRDADTTALLPRRPADEDHRAWYAMAVRLAAAHEELAGARLGFGAAQEHAERLDLLGEGDRWRALGVVAQAYRERLDQAGLVDPAAGHEMALAGGRLRGHVVLLGVTDLNAMQRAIVGALGAAAGPAAVAIVHAPASMADRFDEFGCVLPAAWADARISLDDEEIVIAQTPRDQADAALNAIAALDGAYAADEITIGLGDPDLVAPLARAAAAAGLSLHEAAGRDLRRSGPVRLLESAAAWIEEPRAAHLAALVRHPDLERWLVARDGQGTLFAAASEHVAPLDAYVARHLPERLGGDWPAASGRRRGPVRDLLAAVGDLLRPLRGPDRGLGAWCEPILEVLGRVYEPLAVEGTSVADQHTLAACLQLREVLARHATTAEGLQPRVPAAEALAILIAETIGESIAADVRPEQVELLGWLELHLDPAPALVFVGANDGRVPHTVTGDALLPDALRRSLGLMHNGHFYARDAYLLEAMAHGRAALVVIAGRVTREGDPLAPSRLLLATDEETMLRRVRRLCAPADAPPAPPGAPRAGDVSRFKVPELPADLPLPAAMSVTAFKQYLACPYRFALAQLLRLEASDDAALELDPLQFGTLAHAVLETFGRDTDVRDERDGRRIARYLEAALEAEAGARYGRDPMPAVRLQVARLAQRMRRFAQLQARLREEGWRIRHVELTFEGEPALDVAGQAPMPIRGKVDRVDVHESTGRWRVIDYKAGERGDSPHMSHHGTEKPGEGELEWVDLQLPLYRFLVRSIDLAPPTEPELGYIVLPKDVKGIRYKPAAWTPAQLDEALERARDVVRSIRAREFEMSVEQQPPWDAFARICQTFAFAADEATLADAARGAEGAA